jgi:Na+/H+-dicarboxylate symporter
MKVWIKLLIGSILGVSLGFLLPAGNQSLTDAFAWLDILTIRIGRYALAPMLIFSLTIAIYELRQDGFFWRLLFRSFLAALGIGAAVITTGIIVTLIFPPARIPILVEEQVETVSLSLSETLMEVFPSNMFSSLVAEGTFLLPICVFAFFFAMGLSYDRNYTRPVIALADSFSRIFYHIASFFSEILGFILIVLSAFWTIRFNEILKTGMFRDLIMLLGIFSLILGFVILPLFLLFLKPKANPWAVL